MTHWPNSKPQIIRQPSVFITGASSGLGAALALQYARAGYVLGLVARRQPELEAVVASLPSQHFTYLLDVRDREALHAAAGACKASRSRTSSK